ncbi:probable sodium/potassium-transporting ATPase subunit beta-3 [Ostrea edulis]|uniref:probable sodium/potassium-transporting ATPase subunit beta-3 n=1 Tax=Ostrea edulis TaxID=37623 RepID=UPI002095EF4C|nr:probable sodium/potassium-transporting ATPase subunit beta-3 [Ostrea edulis]
MASTASTGVETATTIPPQNPSLSQRVNDFCTFVYNSEEGSVLGRTGKSWAQIGIFYLIYYACLSAFFAGMMAIFYQTLDWNYPRLQGPDTLLKQNPGLGFRPIPDVQSTLVRFVKADASTYSPYTDHIQAFLEYYENQNLNPQDGGTVADCDSVNRRRPEKDWDKPCRFDLTANLGADCVKQQTFGFDDGMPCILLKLNKIFDWQPESFTNDTVPTEVAGLWEPYHVTIKCEGENPSDRDNIGPIEYYPQGGFHFKYFPFRNQQAYRSPLVMARFTQPASGVLIMVECKAYARNIRHNRLEKAGMVHFELMVD